MTGKRYDVIYSLGTDCACSLYMKRHNLRTTSGPFDWLTHADFDTRANLILSNFDRFFDKHDIVPLEKDSEALNDTTHDYYANSHNGFFYYHDFHHDSDFDDEYEANKKKYCRRIQRFYNNITKARNPLLVWLSHNQYTPDDLLRNRCREIELKLKKEIDFIIIEHDERKEDEEIEKIDISERIVRFRLQTLGFDEDGKPTTMGIEENCDRVFGIIQRERRVIVESVLYILSRIGKKSTKLLQRLGLPFH